MLNSLASPERAAYREGIARIDLVTYFGPVRLKSRWAAVV